MKDLLERVLKQLPTYLPDLANLVRRPKTSIQRWVEEAQGDLTRPLIFVSVTVAFGFLLQFPGLAKEHDFMKVAVSMAVFKIVALVLAAATIHVLFRIAGGGAKFTATFSVYLYIVSPLYLAGIVLQIAALGVLRAYDPAATMAAVSNPSILIPPAGESGTTEFMQTPFGFAWTALMGMLITLLFAWPIACWGALRHLHAIARWRSVLVGLMTFPAVGLVLVAMTYFMVGMLNTRTPVLQ